MIALGERKIAKIFLGDLKIGKAYLGDELVYQSRKPSRLPEGYTEVEYIQSGNGQYINTGMSALNIYRLEMDVEPLAATGYIYAGPGSSVGFLCRMYSTYIQFTVQLTNTPRVFTISGNFVNKRIKILFDRFEKKVAVDDQEKAFTASGWYGNMYTLYLLYGTNPASTSTTYPPLAAKLYSCKIYNANDEIVKDFVPCIDPNGHVGAYELVAGAFRYHSASNEFIAGPAV